MSLAFFNGALILCKWTYIYGDDEIACVEGLVRARIECLLFKMTYFFWLVGLVVFLCIVLHLFRCLHGETLRIVVAQGLSWNRPLRKLQIHGKFWVIRLVLFSLPSQESWVKCTVKKISVMVTWKSISKFVTKNLQPWFV